MMRGSNLHSIATIGSQLYLSVKAASNKRGASIFLGAGASIASGIPSWENLAEEVCNDLAISINSDLPAFEAINQILNDGVAGKDRFEILSRKLRAGSPSRGYHHLAQLASQGFISTIFTTNWDCLLEEALSRQIRPDKIRVLVRGLVSDEKIAKALKHEISGEVTIVKLHGDLANRYFFIKPSEVKEFDPILELEIIETLRNSLSFIVGASASDLNVLNVLLKVKSERLYFTEYDVASSSAVIDFIKKSGAKSINGQHKVVTKNDTTVNIGDFDNFFSQLNLQVQLKINADSKDSLLASEKAILSKEEVGLRYINNTQINRLIEDFWLKISRENPQHIVFINDPQAPGGQELKRRLSPILIKNNISFEDIVIKGETKARSFNRKAFERDSYAITTSPTKVLVLDAITFSGRTLELAIDEVSKWFPFANIKCGVLVVSQDLLRRTADNEKIKNIIYAKETDRFEIFFPWGITQTTSDFNRAFNQREDNTRLVRIYKRPWGAVERLAEQEYCSVRLLVIEANSKLSFQRHLCRDELYVALDDHIGLKIAGHLNNIDSIDEYDSQIKSVILEKGDYVLIPRGVWHRPEASMDRARILEIGFGVYDQQYDIERLFDIYGREAKDGKE